MNEEKTIITVDVISEKYDNPGYFDNTQVTWSNNSPDLKADEMIEAFAGVMLNLTYQPGSVIKAMRNFIDEHQSWRFREDEGPGRFE